VSVSGTYAEALYEAAAEAGAVPAVQAELADFRQAVLDSADLAAVLSSPEVETPRKKAVVAELAAAANPLVARFLGMLVERGRIGQLDEIARAFDGRVAEAEGRLTVEAVTAVPLTDDLRQAVIAKVKADTGRDASLSERVDPDLLGGLVLRVGGIVVDGSIRSRIAALRRSLTQAPVESGASA